MSITINPIDNGTNVITAIDAASQITVSGMRLAETVKISLSHFLLALTRPLLQL